MNIKYNIGLSTRLGLQVAWSLLGNVFTLLVGFPLFVFVARKLGAAELGLFSVVDGIIGLVAGLLGFGMAQTLTRFVPVALERKDHTGVRLLVTSTGRILLVAGLVAVALSWLLLPTLRQYLPVVDNYPWLWTVMSWMIPLALLMFFLQKGLQAFGETGFVVFCSSVVQLGTKALLAVALLSWGLQLGGYMTAVVVARVIACALLALLFWRKLVALPSAAEQPAPQVDADWFTHARACYFESLPGIGASWLDRFILVLLAGPAQVGILLIIKQLQQMPMAFLQMFTTVITPLCTAAHARGDDGERQHLLHFTIDWVVRLSVPLCIFLLLFAQPLLHIYGDDFAAQGAWPLRILVLAQLSSLVIGPLAPLLNANGRGSSLRKLKVDELVVLIIGMVLLVPQLGLLGAALTLAFNTLWQNLAIVLLARKTLALHLLDPRYWRWLLPAVSVAISGGAMLLYGPGNPGLLLLLLILILLYVAFLLVSLLQGLHADDRAVIAHIASRLRNKHGVTGVLKYMVYEHVLSRVADLRGRGVYSLHADKFQCIFIHIPKAAGTSVALTLFNQGSSHVAWLDYYHANPDKFRRYFKFSFVRNPWDRLASTYFFLKRGGMNEGDAAWAKANLEPYPTFESFVKGWLNEKNIHTWEHFRPQHYFICDEDGKVQMDFVGRVENMDLDFRVVAERLRCPRTLAKVNVGNLQHYSSYYTDELREIAARVYARDIELFGYQFEKVGQ